MTPALLLLALAASYTAGRTWAELQDLVIGYRVARNAERVCAAEGLTEAQAMARALWVDPLLKAAGYAVATALAVLFLIVAS